MRELEAFLTDARAMRSRRGEAMLDRLHALGIVVPREVLAQEAAGGAIGRPHVARALQRLGHVASVQAAFDRYIGRGRPAYVEKELPTLTALATLIHGRGGVVSAAHLKSQGSRETLTVLKAQGLDAVETRHPSHDGDRVATLTELALALEAGRPGRVKASETTRAATIRPQAAGLHLAGGGPPRVGGNGFRRPSPAPTAPTPRLRSRPLWRARRRGGLRRG